MLLCHWQNQTFFFVQSINGLDSCLSNKCFLSLSFLSNSWDMKRISTDDRVSFIFKDTYLTTILNEISLRWDVFLINHFVTLSSIHDLNEVRYSLKSICENLVFFLHVLFIRIRFFLQSRIKITSFSMTFSKRSFSELNSQIHGGKKLNGDHLEM